MKTREQNVQYIITRYPGAKQYNACEFFDINYFLHYSYFTTFFSINDEVFPHLNSHKQL